MLKKDKPGDSMVIWLAFKVPMDKTLSKSMNECMLTCQSLKETIIGTSLRKNTKTSYVKFCFH